MMLGGLLKAVVNFICGLGQDSKPQPTPQPQGQYPSTQQASKPPVPQHHHLSTQQVFKPSVPQHHPPERPHQTVSSYNKDQNYINQNDPHYISLRSQANEQGDAMANCFEQSHRAYANGDGARAKELSNKGKEHQKRMEDLNKQASEWIFLENNKDSKPHEVDLHGLYVKEAISCTDRALERAKARGDREIHLIVGKGLHSKNGSAKLKPAIEELIQKYKLSAELDPNNSGVLIVQLNSSSNRGVDAGEITRRIEHNGDSCIIM